MPILQTNLRLSLKTILFTTDFSPASQAALPYVQALVRWYGSKVIVAHSVPLEPALSVPMDATPLNMNLSWQDAQNKMTAFPAHGPAARHCARDGVGGGRTLGCALRSNPAARY